METEQVYTDPDSYREAVRTQITENPEHPAIDVSLKGHNLDGTDLNIIRIFPYYYGDDRIDFRLWGVNKAGDIFSLSGISKALDPKLDTDGYTEDEIIDVDSGKLTTEDGYSYWKPLDSPDISSIMQRAPIRIQR